MTPRHDYAGSLRHQVPRQQQHEEEAQRSEDRQVLVALGHGVAPEAVVLVLGEARDRDRHGLEGVLRRAAARAAPVRLDVLEGRGRGDALGALLGVVLVLADLHMYFPVSFSRNFSAARRRAISFWRSVSWGAAGSGSVVAMGTSSTGAH